MLRYLFTRLGSQFREAGIIHAKFVAASGIVYAAKSSAAGTSHPDLSLATAGSGVHTLTLAGGCRDMAVLDIRHLNVADPTDVTDNRSCDVKSITPSTGAIVFHTTTEDGTEAAADPAATDEIHVTLYVAK